MIIADDIKIDTDEGRYTLTVWSDDEPEAMRGIVVDIHDLVLDFYAQVQREIRPYVLEAESARVLPDGNDLYGDPGYALDDPKSPGYHDRMVD